MISENDFRKKVKAAHEVVKAENARFGLPMLDYDRARKCVVKVYADGRREFVTQFHKKDNQPEHHYYLER